jgi:hypothetical protein
VASGKEGYKGVIHQITLPDKGFAYLIPHCPHSCCGILNGICFHLSWLYPIFRRLSNRGFIRFRRGAFFPKRPDTRLAGNLGKKGKKDKKGKNWPVTG